MINETRPGRGGQQLGLSSSKSAPSIVATPPVTVKPPHLSHSGSRPGYLLVCTDRPGLAALAAGERAPVSLVATRQPLNSVSLRTGGNVNVVRVLPAADPDQARQRADRLLDRWRVSAGRYLANWGELRGALSWA